MTVLDLITLIRRGWKILTLAIIIGIIAGIVYSLVAPKVYQSTASGFIAATGSSVVAGSDDAVARAGAYMPLINSSKVRQVIADEAGVPASALSGTLSARVVPGSTMIQVTAAAADPQSALKLANGALNALAAVVADIEKQAGNVGENAPIDAQGITIVPMDAAVAPTSPASPDLKLALGFGALAGLIVGLVVILMRKVLDVRVRAHTDIAALTGVGVLGRVPKIDTEGTSKKAVLARRIADEAYRQIRTGLRFSSIDDQVRVVMISSANQGEGKSITARSLAKVMAESGRRTLIVDGDLRRPTVADSFGIHGHVGLSEVLSGQIPALQAIRATPDRNLFVLPSGGIPPNPSEMLGSTAMHDLLAALRREFFVIVDAPPVLPVTDASVLSAAVDGVVLVAAVGRTHKSDLAEARTQLDLVRARVLGVVLNLVSLKGGENGYGYYQQNSKYYVQSSEAASAEDADDGLDMIAALADLTPTSSASEQVDAAPAAPQRRERGSRTRDALRNSTT